MFTLAFIPCIVCDGTGVVSSYSFGGKAHWEVCRQCEGSGRLLSRPGRQPEAFSSLEGTGVTRFGERMSREVGQLLGLSFRQIADLTLVSRVYDIGKLVLPRRLLVKSSALDARDRKLIRQHPGVSREIAVMRMGLHDLGDAIISHHEHWDGSGYPRGLRGPHIPLLARITTVVDAYEAMVTPRPYRERLTAQKALEELRKCAGQQFDPRVVSVFDRLLREHLPELRPGQRSHHERSRDSTPSLPADH